MLDENLPTFYIKPSTEKNPKFNSSFYFCQHGAEPQPAYALRHLDPSLQSSKNRYAIALYDSFAPDVLYGEVLLIPKWTQPTLSQEAIRQHGGTSPPPEPILPHEFTIQLYNPDQQVLVRYKPKSWNTPASWEFEMPQQTFRQPSASTLDRTMSDPAASDLTPKLRFNWRKDGKLSKDISCYLSGKTLNPDGTKKKSKEPDITVAIFQALKEITLYEPNLYRVEMEDFKGLEVVLLLGATVIRDVYFGQMRDVFHISDPPKPGSPTLVNPAATSGPNSNTSPIKTGNASSNKPSKPPLTIPPQSQQRPITNTPPQPRPPPTDPRTQWELNNETERLKQAAKQEARDRRRREKEEEKRTRKFLENEEKEKRRRQAAVDQETERLKKVYGKQQVAQSRPSLPARPPAPQNNVGSSGQQHHHRYSSYPHPNPSSSSMLNPYGQIMHQRPPPRPAPGPAPGPAVIQRPHSTVQFLTPSFGNPNAQAMRPPPPQLKEKRSFFGFRKKEEGGIGGNGGGGNTLAKKRSSMF